MARDNRIIHSAVRLEVLADVNAGRFLPDGTTPAPEVLQTQSTAFGPGQEDELASALTPSDGKRLLDAGVLEGDWKFTGEEQPLLLPKDSGTPTTEATPEEQAEQAASFISGTFSVARSSEESALDFLDRVVVRDSEASDEDEAEALDADIEELLRTRFDGPDAVQAASDKDILAINGIGPKSLPKIRRVYPFNG